VSEEEASILGYWLGDVQSDSFVPAIFAMEILVQAIFAMEILVQAIFAMEILVQAIFAMEILVLAIFATYTGVRSVSLVFWLYAGKCNKINK
jgi:hypothetical protein